jgi:hypothetical protein
MKRGSPDPLMGLVIGLFTRGADLVNRQGALNDRDRKPKLPHGEFGPCKVTPAAIGRKKMKAE